MKLPANAVGLCAGRHDIPVTKYIFDKVEDVLDFEELNRIALQFVVDNCNIHTCYGLGVEQADWNEVLLFEGNALDVVVTGLTPCTTAVMWVCARNGIPLTLWHYNRETGDYVPQKFNF